MKFFRFSISGPRNRPTTIDVESDVTTDRALLRQYLAGSEAAFTELMRRHVDLVYSAALRQMKNAALAEDVTQEVFVTMSRMPGKIAKEAAISAWLYNTTRYLCLNALRRERRRHLHETRAAQMTQKTFDPTSADDESLWETLKPVLDEAMAKLSKPDRRLIVMRYFDHRDNQQMARMLALEPNTVAKQTQRARDRLRNILRRYGVTVEAAWLGAALARHAVQSSPASLILKSAALAAAEKGAASGAFAGTKGVVTIMGWTKAQAAGAAIAAAMLVGGTTYIVSDHSPGTPAQAAAVPASQPNNAWKQPFALAYSLAPDEDVKCIPSPYMPERAEFMRAKPMFQMGSARRPRLIFTCGLVRPLNTIFMNDNELFDRMGILHLADGNYLRLYSVTTSQSLMAILYAAGFARYQFESNVSLDRISLPADFIIRAGADHEHFLNQLQKITAEHLHHPLLFTRRNVVRNVLQISGNFYKEGNVTSSKSSKNKFLDVFGDFQDDNGVQIFNSLGFGFYLQNRLHMKVENTAVDDTSKPGEYSGIGLRPTINISPSTQPSESLVMSMIEKLQANSNLKLQVVPREMEIWEMTIGSSSAR